MRGEVNVETIRAVVRELFEVAGLDPESGMDSVVPLRALIAAQPLLVEELPQLTRRTAETYLRSWGRVAMESTAAHDEALAGFLFANTAGGWILVNRPDSLVRRRFSIAHELGHYLLHFLPVADAKTSTLQSGEGIEFRELLLHADVEEGGSPSAGLVHCPEVYSIRPNLDAATMELEADRFAAEILMPEPLCCQVVEQVSRRHRLGRETLARRLATQFLVSQSAMQYRLDELGLAPSR